MIELAVLFVSSLVLGGLIATAFVVREQQGVLRGHSVEIDYLKGKIVFMQRELTAHYRVLDTRKEERVVGGLERHYTEEAAKMRWR